MKPAQSRMARSALRIGIKDLAETAKVSTNTITRFESGEVLRERTVEDIQRAYETAGVRFISEDGWIGTMIRDA
ncbi:helix-turn-helix domain-containing protein [Hoeflea sp. G2-23]|uniref:Helix-turn-helix domain-containing protein n=1 Tax=Hoeflea algicola TaxID=2983763 RepID=A0ABT3ZDH0_9HYPH|nr:transcriptional regulator [Hoeflea algicola]MCY0149844.1 helix-turn-helix domain-containing protein [Hoeflea algicola]